MADLKRCGLSAREMNAILYENAAAPGAEAEGLTRWRQLEGVDHRRTACLRRSHSCRR